MHLLRVSTMYLCDTNILSELARLRPNADMLLAATAQLHTFTLVTRNTRDFEDCAISLLNPFQ